MKKYLFSIILAVLLFAIPSHAEFFRDVIVTSPNAIWTDSRAYNTLNDAITAVGANDREIVIVNEQIVTTLTVPSNVRLKFLRDGSIANSGQLTINTKNISADNRQIFTGTGDIDFASGSVVKSTWFSDLDEAFDVTSDDTLTMIISASATTTADMAVGNNVTLHWNSPFIITVDAGDTVSNLKNIEAGNYQIFAGAGEFNFLAGTKLSSAWFPHFKTAIDYINADQVTLEVTQTEVLDDNRTVNANTTLSFLQGGIVSVDAGKTLTINGQIVAPLAEIFGGAGTVTYNGNGIWYTDWEGIASILITSDANGLEIAGKGVIEGDATAGRVLRATKVYLTDGTNATTIKTSLISTYLFNGDSVTPPIDNMGSGYDGTYFALVGTTQLKIKPAAFTGDLVGVLSSSIHRNLSGVTLTAHLYKNGDDVQLTLYNTLGAAQSMTTLVDTGDVSIVFTYITSE